MDTTPPTSELIGLTGRHKGKRYPLDRAMLKIGQDEACDLRLLVEGVEPVHAILVTLADSVLVSGWDGQVYVDGNPVTQEPLKDKSILRFGPLQFQLRLVTTASNTLRLHSEESEESAPLPLPSGSDLEALEARRTQLEALQRQLRESRSRFREEKRRQESEIEQQFRDLAEAFDEADRREQRADKERERILKLRTRMIQRWKRHWSNERRSIEKQTHTLQQELTQLVSRTTAFEAERTATHEALEMERKALKERENEIEVEHAAWAISRDEERRQLDLQRLELEEGRNRLERRDRGLRNDHRRLERSVKHLQQEASGLEARIKNLRKVVDDLDRRKQDGVQPVEEPAILQLSNDLPPGAIYIKSPLRPEEMVQEQRRERLESFARALSDQQAVLVEQIDRMSIAKEFWRAEEKRVVDELERLIHEMQGQDELILQRDEELNRREQMLIHEQQEFREQRQRFESAQARLTLEESHFRGERERKRAEIYQSQRHAERIQQTYETLCHRWLTSRAEEEDQRREAHQHLNDLRERYLNVLRSEQAQRSQLEDRERQVAQREMIVELMRQSMEEKSGNAQVFERRIERHRRHVMATFRRAESKLNATREAVQAESESLRELFTLATDRVLSVTQREDELRKRGIELEATSTQMQSREADTTELRERLEQQNAAYERELQELRAEWDRLVPRGEPQALEIFRAA